MTWRRLIIFFRSCFIRGIHCHVALVLIHGPTSIHYSVPWTTGRRSANLGRSGTATYIKRKYNFSQWKSYLPLVLYRKKQKKDHSHKVKSNNRRSSPTKLEQQWHGTGQRPWSSRRRMFFPTSLQVGSSFSENQSTSFKPIKKLSMHIDSFLF